MLPMYLLLERGREKTVVCLRPCIFGRIIWVERRFLPTLGIMFVLYCCYLSLHRYLLAMSVTTMCIYCLVTYSHTVLNTRKKVLTDVQANFVFIFGSFLNIKIVYNVHEIMI